MELWDLICCPSCKGALEEHPPDRSAASTRSHCACTGCGTEYPIVGDVVDFLPDLERKRSLAQRLMESRRIVSIYESIWWRGNRGFSLLGGIDLEEEKSLIEKILAIQPGDGVLDLACGTGLYARRFAREGPERYVVGLDLSWPMLRWGVTKSETERSSNLAFVRGDAQHLPFVNASLDAANCCAALHLFPDARRVLGELQRVIKPGGRFSTAVVLRGGVRFPSRLGQALGQRVGVRGFREQELEALLDAAGFDPTVHHARGIWMIAGGIRRD